MRPRLLDLFCCEGGAAVGYHRAGFDIVGIDRDGKFAKRYPFEFHQADAIEFIREHGHEFDAIHASPPCQAYSGTQKIQNNDHPDLIGPTRDALEATGVPYVIENVPGAPLLDPALLCGAMFGLETYRHRLFESSVVIETPPHPEHVAPLTKMGRPPKPGEFMHIVGNFSGVDRGREVMEMPWASRDGLREAIPPAYTTWVGLALRVALDEMETQLEAAS